MTKTLTVYFKAHDLHIGGSELQEYVDIFIKSMNEWLNAKIETRGFVTLNEAIEDMGMARKFKYIPYGFDTEVDIQYDKERDIGKIVAKKLYFDYPESVEDGSGISMRVMEGK